MNGNRLFKPENIFLHFVPHSLEYDEVSTNHFPLRSCSSFSFALQFLLLGLLFLNVLPRWGCLKLLTVLDLDSWN